VRALAAAGTDILLTTHYLAGADELADHVVVIDHGRVVTAGPLGEIKASIGRDVIDVAVSDPAMLPAVALILERVTAARLGSSRPGGT
jgi:ABC-type multidrug transport system ATPase subunit